MLLPFFTWVEGSAVGEAIRTSQWLFPTIEAVHLLGLALLGGAVLVVDLALFGFGWRRQPLAQTARDAEPWLIGGLFVMLPTGALLFTSEAIKCYYHEAFWMKMTSLALALAFTFTVRRRVVMADDIGLPLLRRRLIGLMSLALWSGVGIGGRWIGFS